MKRLKQYIQHDYKQNILRAPEDCASYERLCEYSSGGLQADERLKIESHISRCYSCLDAVVATHDAGRRFRRGRSAIRKECLYLVLSVLCFILSFICSRYFLQFLAATLLLGIKWIIDSKTTKTLVMINEAWKRENGQEAKRGEKGPVAKKRIDF